MNIPFKGTGKTLTGVALIKLFCIINQKYFEFRGGNKHFVVFCGPSNKSVDLVTGTSITGSAIVLTFLQLENDQ